MCFEHGFTTSPLGNILLSQCPGLMAALNLCCAVQSFVGQDSGSLGWMCKGYTFGVERKVVKIFLGRGYWGTCPHTFWVWRAQFTPSWKRPQLTVQASRNATQWFFWRGPVGWNTGSASITVNSQVYVVGSPTALRCTSTVSSGSSP